MAEYYGGAPNAFSGGMEWGAARRARQLKENALNALIARYGPEAADPQSAALMQRVEQSGELHPYDVHEAARQNAARTALVAEHGAIAGDPNAQARDIELETRDNALKMQAAKRAAAVLKLTKDRNGDLGSAFDFVQQALPAIGIPPENMMQIREAIIADPNNVDELVAMLQNPELDSRKSLSGGQAMYNDQTGKLEYVIPTESGHRVIPGYTPATAAQAEERLAQGAQRVGQGWKRISQEDAKMAGFDAPTGFQIWQAPDGRIEALPITGSEQEVELDKARTEVEATDRKFLRAAATVTANSEIVTREAERAVPYFKGARAGIVMQTLRLGTKLVPGTDAFNANDAIQEIKAKVSIDALQEMRANSPTGGAMGNVSDKDISILESALGRLETQRDPARMVEDINYITSAYNRIVNYAKEDAKRANTRIEERAKRRVTAPATKPISEQSDDELFKILNGKGN